MNHEIESFISDLKGQGHSIVRSIGQVAATFNLDLDAAKTAVHNSAAWSPQKEEHDALHESLVEMLESGALDEPTSEEASSDQAP